MRIVVAIAVAAALTGSGFVHACSCIGAPAISVRAQNLVSNEMQVVRVRVLDVGENPNAHPLIRKRLTVVALERVLGEQDINYIAAPDDRWSCEIPNLEKGE